MFLDEARLCAGLAHPNIPQIFEVGEQDGLPYIVMEYVPGPNLSLVRRQMQANGQQAHAVMALVMAQVSRALAYAHALTDASGRPLNIIHRDVSLPNVLIGADGIARLIDFGIARSAMSSAATEVGTLKGKVAYMAPEQLIGKPHDLRVDIYQVGVCLYWMTTGEPPYSGDNPVAIWNAHMEGALQRPSERVPGYPPALEAIVLRAMAVKPEDRYPVAASLAEALERFAQAEAPQVNAAAISAWIAQLFPGDQLQAMMNGPQDGNTGSLSGMRRTTGAGSRPRASAALAEAGRLAEAGLAEAPLDRGAANGSLRALPVAPPERVVARTSYEVQAVLKQVEAEAIRLGAPASVASGATSSLASALGDVYPPPEVFTLYPRQMAAMIVSGGAEGLSRAAIASRLRSKFYAAGIAQ